MRPNRLRELFESNATTIGTHLFLCDPIVVEMIGHTGVFDYVEFLAEYSAYDLRGLEDFCRAAELSKLGSMIKVDFENHAFVAQRAVGAGFESVLFADARSADMSGNSCRRLRQTRLNMPGGSESGPVVTRCPRMGGHPSTSRRCDASWSR